MKEMANAASPLRAPMPHPRIVTSPVRIITLAPMTRVRVGTGGSTTWWTARSSSVSDSRSVAVMASPVPALGELSDAAGAGGPQPEDLAHQGGRGDEQHDHRLDHRDHVVGGGRVRGHDVAA